VRKLSNPRPSHGGSAATVDAGFPLMDSSSAVSPTVRLEGSTLSLAFYLPRCEDSAVVQFTHVTSWYYGGPNDEGLGSHPLSRRGLTFYNFHRVADSAEGPCWVATFHDGTFEVVAQEAAVLAMAVAGASPGEALNSCLGSGLNEELDR
jgi:hypothetical protein